MDKTWIRHVLKGTATWKANESEMYALIKPCNLPQTQSNLNEKLESYRCLYNKGLKALNGSHF